MTTTTQSSTEVGITISGMTCASCVAHVEKAARSVAGVQDVRVNLARGNALVNFDPDATAPDQIARAISDHGYPASAQLSGLANVEEQRVASQAAHTRSWFRRALVGTLLWLPFELVHWGSYLFGAHAAHAVHDRMIWIGLAASTLSITYVGWGFYKSAYKALLRRTSNMDTLISMGATVAYVYSLVALVGYLAGAWATLPDLYFMEGAGLLALISIGHWLEARARDSAGRAIRELLNLAPATAVRIIGDEASQVEDIPVSSLAVGDRVLIRPGASIAADGVVIAGRSSVDESMITGESLPVIRDLNDEVIGGTVNGDGRLTVRVTRVGSETALAQIIRLVDAAQSSRPPVQRLADRISAVFVPAVLMIALITGVAWYVTGQVAGWDQAYMWGMLAKSVCSVLIIACPCALGLAVPAALMVGTGRGARRGILIRDVESLQNAERIDTVLLDKTGTLTVGRPAVARVIPLNGIAEDELLRLAAAAEQFSEHPLAKAVVNSARQQQIRIPEPDSFSNEPGLGVVAEVEGRTLLVGSEALVQSRGGRIPAHANDDAHTLVHVAQTVGDGQVVPLGVIALSDELKEDSAQAVEELHRLGLRTILLTGDNHATALEIARRVGIDDVRAGVRPEGKVEVVRELQRDGRRIAMVGDGINDAPALASANLGIAVGSAADVAKEAGGIVLVGHSVQGVASAIRLSRATMRVIKQNLFFAFIYNVLAIPLAAVGLLNPLIAAAAMGLSDITVLGNALRLRRARID